MFARLKKNQKPTNNNSKPPAPGKFCLFFFPSLEDWYSTGKEIEKLQTFSLPPHVPVGPGSLKAKQISIYFSRDRTRQLRLLIGNSGTAFSVYLFICLFVFFAHELTFLCIVLPGSMFSLGPERHVLHTTPVQECGLLSQKFCLAGTAEDHLGLPFSDQSARGSYF